MELKNSLSSLNWMMQHVGITLYSISERNAQIHEWKLNYVIARKGAFPFNIGFVCSHLRTGDNVLFTLDDLDVHLFQNKEDAKSALAKNANELKGVI